MKKEHLILISVLWLLPASLHAQFIHFQMNVEPELSTDVVQDLNFGNFTASSGIQQIKKGSPGMGVFEIRGLQLQNIAVTLNPPKELQHSNPEVEDRIPVDLKASYTKGDQDLSNSQPFSNNSAWFTLGEKTDEAANDNIWQSAFVYIYGSVSIGDISNGTYNGMLILTVEYL